MQDLSLRKLWVLMVTAFVDLLGYALVLPLLPYYARDLAVDDERVIGLLLATFAFGQLLTAPLWGRLSDRVGRRPVILWGQALSALAFLLFAHASTVTLLFLSRLLQGAGGGTLSANQAYVSDAVRPEQRAQALGWITACTSAGVMFGPAIGSWATTLGREAPGWIAAGFCVLNLIFAWRWLPEARERPKSPPKTVRPQRSLRAAIADVFRAPTLPAHAMIWIYCGSMMAFMASSNMMSLLLADRFDVTRQRIGDYYFVLGLVSVVMRAIVLGWMVRNFGENRVLQVGGLCLAVGLITAPLAPTAGIFLTLILLVPIGTSLLFPSTTSLISRYSPPSQIGQIHGVQQAFGGSSRLLAPIWAAAAYRAMRPSEEAGILGGALPYWIGAAIVLATMAFAVRQPSAPDAEDDRAEDE